MPLLDKLWIGPLIGFILAFILIDDDVPFQIVGGVILATAALVVQVLLQYIIMKFIKRNMSFLQGEEKFIQLILVLGAHIAKSDGVVSEEEIEHVRKKLEEDFKPEKADKYIAFYKEQLNKKVKIGKICRTIDYDFDEYAKTHLLYFLVGIATADHLLKESELVSLKQVVRYCHIKTSLTTVLKSFEFKKERTYQDYSKKQSSQGGRKTSSNASQLKTAYAMLGLSQNASLDAIKKAYRKLAKIHHPDKVSHLGEVYQKKAKEKFQLIVDAYDLIKEKRTA